MKTRLPAAFFQDSDTPALAKRLIGKELHTRINGQYCSGLIVETEAYHGKQDRACHAYNNRRTKRTESMYLEGGRAYVYLCYGIHRMLNIVSSVAEEPKAILIRAVHPLYGLDLMLERRGKKQEKGIAIGPGNLCKAMGIELHHDGIWLKEEVWISESNQSIDHDAIKSTKRIGIDYAREDALKPWRFVYEPLFY